VSCKFTSLQPGDIGETICNGNRIFAKELFKPCGGDPLRQTLQGFLLSGVEAQNFGYEVIGTGQ
jgi:hypothetical protein